MATATMAMAEPLLRALEERLTKAAQEAVAGVVAEARTDLERIFQVV